MKLSLLKINNFRNFQSAAFQFSPTCNFIYGDNGAGKTSLLEAIYLFGYGRSFRAPQSQRLIQRGADQFSLYSEIVFDESHHYQVGMQRSQQGRMTTRLSGESVGLAELAKHFPILLMNPSCYQLLTSGPQYRRQFLDWGLFHVEQSFINVWQRFQKILKQRNAALRLNPTKFQDVCHWDQELVAAANQIDTYRRDYFQKFIPVFLEIMSEFMPIDDLTIEYYSGWRHGVSLEPLLKESFYKDRQLGYTYYGPQRADIKIHLSEIPIQDVYSRGQQKLMFCALQCAQGLLLSQLTEKQSIYLIDDLPAELDKENSIKVMRLLSDMNSQIFVSALTPELLDDLDFQLSSKIFHLISEEEKAVVLDV